MKYQDFRFVDPKPEAGLAVSLRQQGQLLPILVVSEGSQYQVLDGFKRLRAAMASGYPPRMQARVWQDARAVTICAANRAAPAGRRGERSEPEGVARARAVMLRINQDRKELLPLEEALILRAMAKDGKLTQVPDLTTR